jgi:putative NIF3 family GTP cyclohydrolase 1 type 2
MGRSTAAATLAFALAAGTFAAGCKSAPPETPEVKRIHQLEEVLRTYGSVPKIQSWLNTPDKEKAAEDSSKWPPGIAELKPSRVHILDGGGVSLTWYAEETRGVDVFPTGKRPVREPLSATDGSQYRAPFGEDAYVWMRKK